MADIALLVVEELERSRHLEKGGDGFKQVVGFNYLASSTLSQLKEKLSFLKEVGVREMQIASRALEPKNSFSLAAFDAFFSA